MGFIWSLLTLGIIHILAVAMPGPDFAMVIRNSLRYNRRIAIYSILGLCSGILFHLTYCLFGFALVIKNSIILLNIIKGLGSLYLLYLGIDGLVAFSKIIKQKNHVSKNSIPENKNIKKLSENDIAQLQNISALAAWRMGLITNLTNPKVIIYFISLYSQFMQTNISMIKQGIYVLEIIILTFCWFTLVATIMTRDTIKKGFLKMEPVIELLLGLIFSGFGLFMLVELIMHFFK